MNNALWSPRGARAGERNRATGYTGWHTLFDEKICKSAAYAVLQILLCDPKMTQMNGFRIFWRPISWKEACWRTNKVSSQEEDKG